MGRSAPKSEPSPETTLFNRVADNINAAPNAASSHARPTLAFDYERYAPLLNDPSLTDDQKRQCLEALWSLIIGFVELGVTIAPATAQNACGKLPPSASESPVHGDNGLQLNHTQTPPIRAESEAP